MLEREVIVRSLKHIINKYMKDCESDEMISAVISHLLNCIVAPKDFIKKMDDGAVKFNQTNMAEYAERNLLENMQKLDGPTAAADAVLEEQEKQPVSKKEKKR